MTSSRHVALAKHSAAAADLTSAAIPARMGGNAIRSDWPSRVPAADGAGRSALQRMTGPAGGTVTRLPARLRAGIQRISGVDLSDARVIRNSALPESVNALAFARGREIHLAPGQDRHLAHEAWHLVQQRQARVRGTTHVGGVAVNDSAALEHEADRMGGLANLGGAAGSPTFPGGTTANAPRAP